MQAVALPLDVARHKQEEIDLCHSGKKSLPHLGAMRVAGKTGADGKRSRLRNGYDSGGCEGA